MIELDWKNAQGKQVLKFFLKGGPIRCFSMTAGFARATRRAIDAAFADGEVAPPEPPVSCAALLARDMGADGQHALMAAGLAGGIGLSGGACGAAVWLIELAGVTAGGASIEFNSPAPTEAINRFVQCTACEFACANIAGRKFADVHDDASYLAAGGCARVIEALASRAGGGGA